MTSNEKKYVAKRIDDAVMDKIGELAKKVGVSIQYATDHYNRQQGMQISVCSQRVTVAEVNKAVKASGGLKIASQAEIKKAVAKSVTDGYGIRHGLGGFDLIKNCNEINNAIDKITRDKDAWIKGLAQVIVDRGEQVKDEVILGDSKEALKLLASFRKEKI